MHPLGHTINGMRATAYDVVSPQGLSRVWVSSDDAELAAAFREIGERMSMMSMGDPSDPSMMVAEHGIPVLVQTLAYDTYRIKEILSVDRRSLSEGLARSLGDVIIGLEADGGGEGQHEASVSVAGPHGRFEGRGTLTIRAVGQDGFGFAIYEVEFEGADLESGDGRVAHVRGSLSCSAM